ncbi:hypothetical protein HDU83_008335 [Entophlyctis luteolus]|nr:hypothetical protein HDU83_008335 [Entophlyctis luteolus]
MAWCRWNSKSVVQNIFNDLTEKHNLSIWMDKKDMTDVITQAMAEGADSSHVFIPVLTLDYQVHRNARKAYGSAEWNKEMGILASEIVKKKNKSSNTAAQTPHTQRTLQTVDPLQAWLHSVDNSAEVRKHSRAYVQGTRRHFLTYVESWLTEASSHVLWLNGGTGAGKSVIAWLVSQNLPANHVLGSAFYCQHDDEQKNNPESLVATTIHNLCTVLPSFKAFCAAKHAEDQQKVRDGEPSVLTNARAAFQSILVAGLAQLDADDRKKTIVLVVDALDECGKPGSSHRRSLLKLLAQEATNLPPFVRIFATGRPEQDIFEAMVTLDSMVLLQNDEENRKDMSKFVASVFSQRVEAGTLTTATLQTVIEEILEKSSGVFQFARLACDQLVDVPEESILQSLDNFGAGIDGVYDDYFRSVKSNVDTNKFRMVMKLVLAAKEPLTQDEVSALLDIEPWHVGQVLVQVHRILDVSHKNKIKFMHKSLADYLVSGSRCKDPEFLIDTEEGNKEIAAACLRVMLKHCGSVKKFEALCGTAASLPAAGTANYCFKYWHSHLASLEQKTVLGWADWKDFCLPEKYGAHLIWFGIANKKENLVELAFVNSNGIMLMEAARKLRLYPSTPLYEAGKLGLTNACKALIEFGKEDVNCHGFSIGDKKQYGEGNKTVLMVAARGNHAETVRLLLSKGADTTHIDAIGRTASEWGCSAIINQWSKQEETSSLKFFAQHHTPDELQAWLQGSQSAGSAKNTSLERQDNLQQTALYIASKHGQLEVVKWLVDHGANVNAENVNKATPLHIASQNGHLEVVKWLVDHGANVNAENVQKATLLHIASQNGHLEVVKWLVDHGANVNAENVQKATLLHIASQNGHLEVVKWLVDHGANVNAENVNKWTPLHIASSNGHLEVVKWLVDHGANVNAENIQKATPLHIASENGHLEVVKWLVNHGANVNAENVNKATPLYVASWNEQLEVAKWLESHLATKNSVCCIQ